MVMYIILKNISNRNIMKEFINRYPYYKNFSENVDLSNKDQSCSLNNNNPIAQGFLYVGLETIVELPQPFVSRISLRGIIERRPFVIFGCPNTIQFLQSRGFKTFSDFWDESYDTETDTEKRVEKIINIIKYVSSLNLTELKDLYNQMEEIITYNHEFYFNNFAAAEEKYLEKQILKNLERN